MRNERWVVVTRRLIEDLVEFMDCHPTDGTASRLVRRHHNAGKEEEAEKETADALTEDNAERKRGESQSNTPDANTDRRIPCLHRRRGRAIRGRRFHGVR